MYRFYGLAARLRQNFGKRVQKVPLDFGFSCPNRDGNISTKGCIFCNPLGSGSGMHSQSTPIPEQWDFWTKKFTRLYNAKLFLAYLQSYTNTYGTLEQVKCAFDQLRDLPGLAGICIGTRPDCIDAEKLQLIKDLNLKETWLELGLQSSNDTTLALINRGHDAKCFADAVILADSYGIEVCAHVIAGLPGESKKDFIATVEFINSLPVSGIKLHNLYISQGTPLQEMYDRGEFTPFSMEEYLDMLETAVSILRTDIVVHRLNADPAPGELVAPDWIEHKRNVQNAIDMMFENNDLWQGCAREDSPTSPPEWFGPDHLPPGRKRKI
ncbi:TIGR01212 family radical SAM protein [Maridesulfovibrio ferrireducens]|uniref:TIGR01212 family radical SAM protein n=1 Tax=Maridesulfovibrio ferrireducens TaxID=246191 RepID=UPI001A3189AF|nr:TIGR01212 family radical SAM protein [Maridesulfovibrio ferrireducens]MBI9111796.1 TIGR01212 family radical SAM protein [Maridesulfovibrio ferrireducens]